MPDPDPTEHPDLLTSIHVRKAADGNQESLSWIVDRFAPLLMVSASYRLGERLRTIYDPEDIVNEVWMVALPRLASLPDRDGRRTPVLLKFLSTTLVYIVNNLVQKHVRQQRRRVEPASSDSSQTDPLDAVPADVTGVFTKIARGEDSGAIYDSLDQLKDDDREVIILRGIEQMPSKQVAEILGKSAGAVDVQYHRALKRLREKMPGSVFDEL